MCWVVSVGLWEVAAETRTLNLTPPVVLSTVPMLMFATMHHQRHAIRKLGLELERHNQRSGTGINLSQLAKSRHARSSFTSLTVEMQWLLPKFEAFKPTQWYAGIALIALRLLQTSLMALFRSQLVQAIVMCCVTQVAIMLQSELSPYRRASDNTVALLAQLLVISWTFTLMIRIVGVLQKPVAATAIGVLLCIATVSVLVAALLLANTDRLNEQCAELSDSNKAPSVELVVEQADDESVKKEPGEIEAGPSQRRESRGDGEEKVEEDDETSSPTSPWSSILSISSGTLCAAETADDDETILATSAQTSFDKLASLAIAAGVDRSEVAMLTRMHSKQLSPATRDEI